MDKKEILLDYLPLTQSRVISPNHGYYSVTLRETEGAQQVLYDLNNNQKENRPRLHLGWGSYRNLDIIAARNSEYAIICDVSLHQIEMWYLTLSVLRQTKSPKEFIELFCSLTRKNPRPRFPLKSGLSFQDWFYLDINREMSWLNDVDSFLHIKNLATEQKIEIVCCDIRDRSTCNGVDFFSDMYQYLEKMKKEKFCFPDTLYVSNLPWMMKNESGFFGEMHTEENHGIQFPGYLMMLENLKIITPLFSKVISAHELASTSTPDSVQWKTQLFDSDDFIIILEDDVQPNKYPLHKQSQ